jgi:hypothetical protein
MKTLLKILSKDQFGGVRKADLEELIIQMPNLPVLIRCGRDRYVVEAHKANEQMNKVVESGDYIRDVSLPARIIDEMLKSPFTTSEVKQSIVAMRLW